MTNTNELTAKLKAAAQEEIMCREACDTSDLWQDVASPENVLALTEALEAAEERNARQQEVITNQDKWIKEVETTMISAVDRAEAAEKRIVELEARTLTVKLPDYVDGHTLGYGEVNHMIDLCADAIEKACHRDGIKLQIEGE